MKRPAFFDQVKKHFQFLIDDHGFAMLYERGPEGFGNCLVVLQSSDCRIIVALDRGQVFVYASPLSAPDDWFDLSTIIAFLTQGPGADKWEYQFPDTGFDDDYNERQLARLVGILKPYWNQIFRLFREDVFKQKRKELAEFIKKRSDERWK